MDRWLGFGLLLIAVGLLAAILLVLIGLDTQGIAVKLSGPIVIEGASGPQEMRVVLSIPETISIDAGGQAEANLRTTLEGIPCPSCGGGVMVPVKWNPFTGEIVWRCASCGRTMEEHRG